MKGTFLIWIGRNWIVWSTAFILLYQISTLYCNWISVMRTTNYLQQRRACNSIDEDFSELILRTLSVWRSGFAVLKNIQKDSLVKLITSHYHSLLSIQDIKNKVWNWRKHTIYNHTIINQTIINPLVCIKLKV